MARKKRNDPATNGAEGNAAVDSGAGLLPQNAAAGKKKPYIWGACRAAQAADAQWMAWKKANVAAAAQALGGFTLTESGRWVRHCPDCGKKIELYSGNYHVGVSGGLGNSGPSCAEVPRIRQWLDDNGFGVKP
jgi:hypothetical protein